ncbi:MAG: hypothetical protein HY303_11855 [Candidatus Wallbacteria bacterium]|nr:hypothetical protein [Candidatus Wallbacteria bacterium]
MLSSVNRRGNWSVDVEGLKRGLRMAVLLLLVLAGPTREAAALGQPFSVTGTAPSTWGWVRRDGAVPAARSGHAMAYDAARGRVVVFGGQDSGGNYLGDTWEWDGGSWYQRSPATSPAPRALHSLAYDSVRSGTTRGSGMGRTGRRRPRRASPRHGKSTRWPSIRLGVGW